MISFGDMREEARWSAALVREREGYCPCRRGWLLLDIDIWVECGCDKERGPHPEEE